MSSPPTRRAILSLYQSTLRASKGFSSYNFKNYFTRRTREAFDAMKSESDPARLETMYSEAVKELTVLQRGAIVNQLYGGSRIALEDPSRKP